MSQGDGLVVVGLFFGIVIYTLFSTLDLPTLVGGEQRLPPLLQLVHESLAAAYWRRGPSPVRVMSEFLAVLATTQLVPLFLVAGSKVTAQVRVASLIELTLALAWTVLLVLLTTGGSRR